MKSALVVGSGPNGLAAGITLAQAGVDVTVVEAADEIGGGLRSGQETLPGLVHDHCAAIVPTAVGSPFLQSLDLGAFGVEYAYPEVDLVHPLVGGAAGVLYRSLDRTVESLGPDGARWRAMYSRLVRDYDLLAEDLLSPMVAVPGQLIRMALFGAPGMVPASILARVFRSPEARALFGGNAAHAWTPLSRPPTSAVALMFATVAHRYGWPCVVGGTARLADGLAALLRSLGGRIETRAEVQTAQQVAGFDAGCSTRGHVFPPAYWRRGCPRVSTGLWSGTVTEPPHSSWISLFMRESRGPTSRRGLPAPCMCAAIWQM